MPFDLLDELRQEAPDPGRMAQIQTSLAQSLRPVAPLPSDRVLILLMIGGFFALAAAGAAPFGFAGLALLRWPQRALYGGAVLFAAWALAAAVAGQMIPGSRHRFPLSVQVALPLLVIALVTLILFPQFSARHFLTQGFPCLRMGLLCAVPGSVILTIAMRRGFVTDWLAGATAVGAFAGLLGIGALVLHCPIQNSAHILVWHLGVVLIAMLAGATVGWAVSRRS